jgi:hypothetical protein
LRVGDSQTVSRVPCARLRPDRCCGVGGGSRCSVGEESPLHSPLHRQGLWRSERHHRVGERNHGRAWEANWTRHAQGLGTRRRHQPDLCPLQRNRRTQGQSRVSPALSPWRTGVRLRHEPKSCLVFGNGEGLRRNGEVQTRSRNRLVPWKLRAKQRSGDDLAHRKAHLLDQAIKGTLSSSAYRPTVPASGAVRRPLAAVDRRRGVG